MFTDPHAKFYANGLGFVLVANSFQFEVTDLKTNEDIVRVEYVGKVCSY